MDRKEIFEQVIEICKDVFDNEELDILETTSSEDIEEWDSLSHISLINEIEEKYHIAFTLEEIAGSRKIGEIITVITGHLDERGGEM